MHSTKIILAYGQTIIIENFILETWPFVMSILKLLKIIADSAAVSLEETKMLDV